MTKLELDSDEKILLLQALTFYEAWVLEAGHETAERVRSKLTMTPKPESEEDLLNRMLPPYELIVGESGPMDETVEHDLLDWLEKVCT